MMDDLISRKAVIDFIHKEIERTTSWAEHDTQINIEFAVEELPTAYNLDKVVKQLEEELKLADEEKERCARNNPLQFDTAKGYATGIYNALNIIRTGGNM